MPEGMDFLYRPVVEGVHLGWEVWAEDHLDLTAFRLANLALDVRAENAVRSAKK